jgi:hypothetical protein
MLARWRLGRRRALQALESVSPGQVLAWTGDPIATTHLAERLSGLVEGHINHIQLGLSIAAQ